MSPINFTRQTAIHSYCLRSCPWLCTWVMATWNPHWRYCHGITPHSGMWNKNPAPTNDCFVTLKSHLGKILTQSASPGIWEWTVRRKLAKNQEVRRWYWSSRRSEVQRWITCCWVWGLCICGSQWTWAVKVLLRSRSSQDTCNAEKKPHIDIRHCVIYITNKDSCSLKHTLHSSMHEDSCSLFVHPPPFTAWHTPKVTVTARLEGQSKADTLSPIKSQKTKFRDNSVNN